MGCCWSSDADRDEEDNDRTRLINGGNTHPQPIEPSTSEYPRSSSLLKKNDEQSALNKILQIAANNVIDVAALDSHGLEQQELQEKAKQYTQRLSTADAIVRGRLRKKEQFPEESSLEKVATASALSVMDVELVNAFHYSAEEACRNFAVVHDEDLIVQFAMT